MTPELIIITINSRRLLNEAVAQQMAEEEARAKQLAEEQEELRKKQEEEVEKDLKLSVPAPEEDNEVVIADQPSSEEHSLHAEADLSDQDNEEKPYEVDHDDDTQVIKSSRLFDFLFTCCKYALIRM